MSDVWLLEYFKDWNYEKIIAPYSRLYVDVEKYWDEDKELMAKHGMGAIYTKDIYGKDLHIKSNKFISEAKAYYDMNNDLLNEIKLWNKINHAFKYKINFPYYGAIMPNYRNGKNKIYSIMFEFNKRWYL